MPGLTISNQRYVIPDSCTFCKGFGNTVGLQLPLSFNTGYVGLIELAVQQRLVQYFPSLSHQMFLD